MSFQVIDRNAILEDERQQRIKKIRLLERENRENLPKWVEKQQQNFPTAIPLSNTPTLGQVIVDESQKTATDPDIVYQRAEAKIMQIAPKVATEYILDRLTDKDLYYLVNSWDGISKKLREQYSTKGLDKDIFIRLVKEDSKKFDTDLGGKEIGLSNRGLLRQNQKETETEELTARAAEARQREEDDKRDFEAIVVRNERRNEFRPVFEELRKRFDKKKSNNSRG